MVFSNLPYLSWIQPPGQNSRKQLHRGTRPRGSETVPKHFPVLQNHSRDSAKTRKKVFGCVPGSPGLVFGLRSLPDTGQGSQLGDETGPTAGPTLEGW